MPESTGSKRRRKRDSSRNSSVNGSISGREKGPGGISRFFNAFLNCCRAPDGELSGDEPSRKSRKPLSIGARRSTPVKNGKEEEKENVEKKDEKEKVDAGVQIPEKNVETLGERDANVQTQQQVQPEQPEVTVRVDPPTPAGNKDDEAKPTTKSNPTPAVDADQDVQMTDSPAPESTTKTELVDVPLHDASATNPPPTTTTETQKQTEEDDTVSDLPTTNPNTSTELAQAPAEEQRWLLPPLAPRFKGKKCLVLDLDETLVHSSFKVLPLKQRPRKKGANKLTAPAAPLPSRLYHSRRD